MDAATPGSGDYSHPRSVQKRLAKQRNGTTSDLPAMIVRQVLTAVEQELNEDEELGIEGL